MKSRHFSVGTDVDLDRFDYDDSKSEIITSYERWIKRSKVASWPLPTSISGWRPRGVLWVTRCKGHWPDIAANLFPPGLIVSEPIAEVLGVIPRRQAQLIPIKVHIPRAAPPGCPKYFLFNVSAVVDALNLTASRVYNGDTPDPDHLSYDFEDNRLDPSRIPDSMMAFVPRYTNGFVLRGDLVDRIRKLKPSRLLITPVRYKVESESDRRATLARVRREAREINARLQSVVVLSVTQLEKRLGLTLPARARAFFRGKEAAKWTQEEFCDLTDALRATRELREWEGLVWPESLVAIARDGRGGYYALDTARDSDGDCPVVYFDHERAKFDRKSGTITPELEECATTLDEWATRLATGRSALPPLRKGGE